MEGKSNLDSREETIADWLQKIGIPQEQIENISTLLSNQDYKMSQDLVSDPPSVDELVNVFRVPGRWAKKIFGALEKLGQPTGSPKKLGINDVTNLQWAPPKKLLDTFGYDWTYQRSQKNSTKILKNLELHYRSWLKKSTDKQNHPIFLVLSGAGTGKSRLLQEFPSLCYEGVNSPDLKGRLQTAYVFNLSFENGTPAVGDETSGSKEIGIRMLYQLVGNRNFSLIRERHSVEPLEVIEALARILGKEESDLTIILCVDGLQKLHHIPNRRDTPFYSVIAHLSALSNESKSFIVPICSATISLPINEVLAGSPQKRVFLEVPLLSPKHIISKPSTLLSFIMNDMGGHGRALECLLECWQNHFLDGKSSLIDIMNSVRKELKERYPDWHEKYDWLEPVLNVILSNRRVKRDTVILNNLNVDSLCSLGLLSLNRETNCLECPFIWIWFLAKKSSNSFIRDLVFGQYPAIEKKWKGTSYYAPTTWQQWETFNAQYRCLKSYAYENNETIDFATFHHGAIFKKKMDLEFVNKHLTIVRAKKHFHTGSKGDDLIECEEGMKRISEGNHFFLAAPGNPSGDGCCRLFVDKKYSVAEIHQYKLLTKSSLTKSKYLAEKRKATDVNDICIFFTTDSLGWEEVDLPPRSLMIKITNATNYYGPWSARMYYLFKKKLNLNINTMTYEQLQEIPNIGTESAGIIVKERKRKAFSDIEGCAKRTKIPLQFLKTLNCEENEDLNFKEDKIQE